MVYGEEEDRRIEAAHMRAECLKLTESVHQLEHERDAYRSGLCDLLAAAHGTTTADRAVEKARALLKNGPPPQHTEEP